MNEEFTKDQTGFWGAIAGLLLFGRTYLNYKQAKISQKEVKMESEKIGIKETKEVLDGLNTVAEEIISVAKDGLQIKDAAQVVEDLILKPEFKAKLVNMVDGIKNVPSEIKDLDLSEGVELVQFEYDGVKRIIESLKK